MPRIVPPIISEQPPRQSERLFSKRKAAAISGNAPDDQASRGLDRLASSASKTDSADGRLHTPTARYVTNDPFEEFLGQRADSRPISSELLETDTGAEDTDLLSKLFQKAHQTFMNQRPIDSSFNPIPLQSESASDDLQDPREVPCYSEHDDQDDKSFLPGFDLADHELFATDPFKKLADGNFCSSSKSFSDGFSDHSSSSGKPSTQATRKGGALNGFRLFSALPSPAKATSKVNFAMKRFLDF
jgi:hypothetical protein